MSKVETQEVGTYKVLSLSELVANTAQSRGMGVLRGLKSLGYGVFEKQKDHAEFEPLWGLLTGEDEEVRKGAAALVKEHEPRIVELSESILAESQLQPIGVVPHKSGGYDVVFGMRRALARAYNYATGEGSDSIEVRLLEVRNPIELKILSLRENDDREGESPIDRAVTYRWLMKEGNLKAKTLGEKLDVSDQTVYEHLKLLDSKLADKVDAIHSGKLSMDKALKILKARKAGGSEPSQTQQRAKLPAAKALLTAYNSKKKPKRYTPKEWDLLTAPDVRKFLAHFLGLKYTPYVAAKEEKEEEPKKTRKAAKESGNGQAPHVNVKKSTAVDLFISLGRMDARTWDDAKLKDSLENIDNYAEEGQAVETPALAKVLAGLFAAQKDKKEVVVKSE